MQYMEKIDKLKESYITLPLLDSRARETSFREFPHIIKAYKEILGMHYVDHFSINIVLKNGKMLIFSACPEIAYTLYSSRRGVEQDLAISPTFYENLDFYFWQDCYGDQDKVEIMSRKEQRFGIKAGAVLVEEKEGVRYLLSFGTKSNADNFKQDILVNRNLYKQLGNGCLDSMAKSIEKYIETPAQTQLTPAKIYWLNRENAKK